MRKTFMIAFSITALVALVIGGAYTWTTGTAPFNGQFQAGHISGEIVDVSSTGQVLYPLGYGTMVPVLQGWIKNTTPANPGIALHAVAGGGNILGGGHLECDFPGAGLIGGPMTFDDFNPIAPGNAGNHWTWSAAMPADADNNCMDKTFTTTLFVSLST